MYQNKYGMQYPIGALSIMTSCGCNLKCEYCKIAQASNANSPILQKATMQALSDGTFLQNIQKCLNKLEQSCSQIEFIDFWGQEPTLTLHLMAEHIAEWFEIFPNWQACSFSTNTVGHIDRLIQFFIACDNAAKHEFHINVQLSYDGDYSTDNLRGASSSIIHTNLIYLYNELNKINFKNVKLRFNNHAVMSFELLKKLQNSESIYNYTLNLLKWSYEFEDLNTNKKVMIQPGVDIGIEAPAMASVEDGLRLANFCELSDRIIPAEYLKHFPGKRQEDLPYLPHESLYMNFNNPLDSVLSILHREFNIHSIEDALFIIEKDAVFK